MLVARTGSTRDQSLYTHSKNVAELASFRACKFGACEMAHVMGWFHDMGKAQEDFQKYIFDDDAPRGSVDHAFVGAKHVFEKFGLAGKILAYAIMGHHTGLLDYKSNGKSNFHSRIQKEVKIFSEDFPYYPWNLDSLDFPDRFRISNTDSESAFSVAFFCRMLFSCLVDADAMDAEVFTNASSTDIDVGVWFKDVLWSMSHLLDEHVSKFVDDGSDVYKARRIVLEDCRKAAVLDPGFFSLTVPTGGGKTLSSLSFALEHAIQHKLDRIIYVVPFTSIIEQNAQVFRDVFSIIDPCPVLEHHSAVEVSENDSSRIFRSENYNFPLVVTTAVQFYESLFSNKPGKCRKLHNFSKAVIVLDEAQKIPVNFLKPTLLVLKELVEKYNSSVVLCTATQPAISKRKGFDIGLDGVREIIQDVPALFNMLKRVDVKYIGSISDSGLCERLEKHDQVLCIVNTREHARKIFLGLPEEGRFHLSASMCPEHRKIVLDSIFRSLENGETCRVVSTQVIEAGVDIDFPVVYRSLSGLDSIAQAAGRCNRNGKHEISSVFVFRSDTEKNEYYIRKEKYAASQLIGIDADLLSPQMIEKFFELYYWSKSSEWDKKEILQEFLLDATDPEFPFKFNFGTVAKKFRLIEDSRQSVFIPFDERGRELYKELCRCTDRISRSFTRKLQRYMVQVNKKGFEKHMESGVLKMVGPIAVLEDMSFYDESLGSLLSEYSRNKA